MSAKKLPAGLPKPPVGMEYRGRGNGGRWKPFNGAYYNGDKWIIDDDLIGLVEECHYAVKRPAKAAPKIPAHVLRHAKELAAMGDAAKKAAKAKCETPTEVEGKFRVCELAKGHEGAHETVHDGKPVKWKVMAKRRLLGSNIPVLVLPGDAESVARMVSQVSEVIYNDGQTRCPRYAMDDLSAKLLASIGIAAKGAK